jgi:hypothetical protein
VPEKRFASLLTQGIPAPASVTPRDGTPAGQCDVRFDKPTPVVVQISAILTGTGLTQLLYSNLNYPGLGLANQSGYVRVEYGVGASRQVIEVDVTNQTFQLPPVDYAKASWRRFNEAGAFSATPIDVAISLAPGLLGGDALLPVATDAVNDTFGGGGAGRVFQFPRNARFWQLSLGPQLTTAVVPNKDIVIETTSCKVDFNTLSQFPSHPLWPVNDNDVRIRASGADVATEVYCVQYFIQP